MKIVLPPRDKGFNIYSPEFRYILYLEINLHKEIINFKLMSGFSNLKMCNIFCIHNDQFSKDFIFRGVHWIESNRLFVEPTQLEIVLKNFEPI